jgi:hypothetical protein
MPPIYGSFSEWRKAADEVMSDIYGIDSVQKKWRGDEVENRVREEGVRDENQAANISVAGWRLHALPRVMTAREYEARYRDEAKRLRRFYCTLFAFWKSCAFRPCRKGRACAGDAQACLKRHEAFVSREKPFAARQGVLEATPGNIGAPERLARQAMPGGLCG